MTDQADALRKAMAEHFNPPTDIVFKKGTAEYVGHADITRILADIDPLWTWEPQGWDPAGGPLVVERYGMLAMWGTLTLLGKTLPCVGTCEVAKAVSAVEKGRMFVEVDKELIGDLLRNGAMRFGISLGLWSKSDWAEPGQPDSRSVEPERQPEPEPTDFHGWVSQAQHDAWWKSTSLRIKALKDHQRDVLVAQLQDLGLFAEDRRPILPFDQVVVARIEHRLVNAAEMVEAPPEHSAEAIDVMRLATGMDDPLNPPEGMTIEPYEWELAEVTDLDAHDWKLTATAFKLTQKALLVEAVKVAEKIGAPLPERIDDIHGDLASELQLHLVGASAPF